MDFPLLDVMDEENCYEKLVDILHPGGLACPRCGAWEGLGIHRRHREPVVDYQCGGCGRVFNAWTGTALRGVRRSPSELWLILRGIAQGTSTAQLARELGCDRMKLLELRHRLQNFATSALPMTPMADATTEADEMYQNAGEKRYSAPRSRRPATPSWQQSTWPRKLGSRSSADCGRGRS